MQQLKVFLLALSFLSLLLSGNYALANPLKITLDEANSAKMLDYEILILKAELATQAENPEDFISLYQELNSYNPPTDFAERFASLEAFFNQKIKPSLLGRGGFAEAHKAKTFVILLPLSGDFAAAGQAMSDVLDKRLADKKTYVLDTDLYDSMEDLWKLVQMFEPDLIIGPLRKHKAQEFAKYNKTTPTLVFSSLDKPENHPNFLAQASAEETTKKFFSQLFETFDPSEISWLADRSATSKQQLQLVNNFLEQETLGIKLAPEDLQLGVDKSLARAIGSEAGQGRKNWLQNTIKTPLEFNGYVRQDKGLIIISSNQSEAEQLAPLVRYHRLKTPIIWIPTQLPSIEMFYNNLDNWQETYALFPAHFLFQLTEIAPQNPLEQQVGLFRALADIAMDLIEQANMPKPFQLKTQLGKVEVYPEGYFLMPRLVKLTRGKLGFAEISELNP